MTDQPEIFWSVIISMYLGNIVLLALAALLVLLPTLGARLGR